MNSHRRLHSAMFVLGVAPLLLLADVPAWIVLALGLAGALLALSALRPGGRGGPD